MKCNNSIEVKVGGKNGLKNDPKKMIKSQQPKKGDVWCNVD
jgi:hypothetical protein